MLTNIDNKSNASAYSDFSHIPVMITNVVEYLQPKATGVYVDCTFGAGGYTKHLLSLGCKVIAIDQDPDVLPKVQELQEQYNINDKKLIFINDNFRNLSNILSIYEPVDGIVFDLGVSSMQLDCGERGFSFQSNAKLDMRMSRNGVSAYDIVNETPEEELAWIIWKYGDENMSRKIAKAIVNARYKKPIESTFELANIVREVIQHGRGYRNARIDPSTKTFQAIRIAVNDELTALEKALYATIKPLKIGGKLVVVSFHSLEDTIVKQFIKNNSIRKIARSKYAKDVTIEVEARRAFTDLTKHIVTPSDEEVGRNPRARSARLRAAEKVFEDVEIY